MYVYVHVYINIYLYIYVRLYVYVYIHIHTAKMATAAAPGAFPLEAISLQSVDVPVHDMYEMANRRVYVTEQLYTLPFTPHIPFGSASKLSKQLCRIHLRSVDPCSLLARGLCLFHHFPDPLDADDFAAGIVGLHVEDVGSSWQTTGSSTGSIALSSPSPEAHG